MTNLLPHTHNFKHYQEICTATGGCFHIDQKSPVMSPSGSMVNAIKIRYQAHSWMVGLTAPLSFASLDLGTFPLWLLVLMYGTIAAGIWWANHPTVEKETIPRFHLPR